MSLLKQPEYSPKIASLPILLIFVVIGCTQWTVAVCIPTMLNLNPISRSSIECKFEISGM